MSSEQKDGKEKLAEGLRSAGYQEILKVLDLCFGLFSVAMALLALLTSLQGLSSWITFVYLSCFVLVNLALTQLSNRVKNRIRLEVFRVFLFNGVLTFFAFSATDGPFQHYWPAYLVMNFAGGTFFTFWSQRRIFGYLQTLFWLSNFAAANFWMAPVPIEPVQFCIIASVMAMSSSLLVEMVHVFNRFLAKENEMKAQLMQSSKMTALGEMAGGIAHEINNPLAIIKTLSSQIAELAAEHPVDAEAVREMATTNEKTVDRIAKIVQGLRVFSRDSSKDAPQPVNVTRLIENTVSFCQERFKNHGVKLLIDEIPGNLFFTGRETQISQVLLNLLQNAYDAIADAADKWVQIAVAQKDHWLEIRVVDSGPRIADAVRAKIFEPFFTTKEIGTGTGLGLSVSLGIVHEHQGELEMDAGYANTCFVLRLPAIEIQAGMKVPRGDLWKV